jgi:Ca2+/Na+ antiporter
LVHAPLIVAGSAGMVQTALSLAGDWHVPNALLGALILGPLTSIPNCSWPCSCSRGAEACGAPARSR